jgi:hypothetical protein
MTGSIYAEEDVKVVSLIPVKMGKIFSGHNVEHSMTVKRGNRNACWLPRHKGNIVSRDEPFRNCPTS